MTTVTEAVSASSGQGLGGVEQCNTAQSSITEAKQNFGREKLNIKVMLYGCMALFSSSLSHESTQVRSDTPFEKRVQMTAYDHTQ
jgi:hypothetical protein